MAPRPWDGGKPVSARGRYYVQCVANATTTLEETVGNAAAGDELDYLWLYPNTLTPAAAQLFDNGNATAVWAWPAGVTLADMRPIFVPLNLRSRSGFWKVTLSISFSAMAAGAFG